MNRETFKAFLLGEAEKPFSGWDFSYLDHRMESEPLPWSYPSQVLLKLRGDAPPKAMLDMGTGGGEFYAQLAPFPPAAWATESYPPNIELARARLEPLGVHVAGFDDEKQLPLESGLFDFVINRHEYYELSELWRIIQPGGTFLTQQVGDRNDLELAEMLGAPPVSYDTPWHLEIAVEQLRATGFQVLQAQEAFPLTRIYDAGALAYYFKAIPWEIEDFSVGRYLDPLLDVARRIEVEGYVEVTSHRCLVEVRKQ
jgi:SAM-dependent methyltransferase